MNKVIVYKEVDNVVLIHPHPDVAAIYGVDAIAKKEVPHGKPYKIVAIADLPLDGTLNEFGVPNIDKGFRDLWDIDDLELTDGVGAESSRFEGFKNELN